MKQYIEKSEVITEIENKIKEWRLGSSSEAKFRIEAYKELSEWLDTLEVKDDMDAIHPIEDVVSNDTLANSLEISRHGNSRNGETLEEAAKNHKSAIHIVSPQWTSEVENAFKAGAKWQEEHLIGKMEQFLYEELSNGDIECRDMKFLIEYLKLYMKEKLYERIR